MPTFQIPFTTPANYTLSDANKIDVANGNAENLEDKSNVYARWHLNESSGINAPDDSGNNRDGTLVNLPVWITGKMNNALAFSAASSQYINAGDIAAFERTQPFSIEAWIRTTSTGAIAMLMSRMTSSAPYVGWQIYRVNGAGNIRIDLANNLINNYIRVTSSIDFSNGNWRHIVITYDGSSTSAGIKMYADGDIIAVIQDVDTLSSTMVFSSIDLNIAAKGGGDPWEGDIDEVAIYDRAVTASEVAYRYNSGIGRENFIYYSDNPSLYKTAGDSDIIQAWTNFVVTMGSENAGSATHQLSEDGVNWKYWNGSAWVAATTEYNTEATINANIPTFSTAAQKIYVKSFLISDGTQKVEIDLIQVGYTSNQAPTIDAGTNKTCFDAQTIPPFSDCSFSDPDGTVDVARYKIDGEVDVWTEILIGGFGSLLEAVQAFQYQFNNTGIITARLQVEDNQGSTSEDSLTVTVSKYTVTFNVKDSSGNHLTHLNFLPGDGSALQLLDSPFTWDYDFAEFHTEIEKLGWIKKEVDIDVNGPGLIYNVTAEKFLSKDDVDDIAQAVIDKFDTVTITIDEQDKDDIANKISAKAFRFTDVILEVEDDSIEMIIDDDDTIILEVEE